MIGISIDYIFYATLLFIVVASIQGQKELDDKERYTSGNEMFELQDVIDKVECFVCKIVAFEMLIAYSAKSTRQCLAAIFSDICDLLELEQTAVCSSLVHEFSDEVIYVVGQLLLKPDQFCGFLLPTTCGGAYDPVHSPWNVSLPDVPKPPVSAPFLPPSDTPKLRVLQITDIHFDKLYEAGSNVNCEDPLCCRRFENVAEQSFEPAGFWGTPDGRCDLPLRTLVNFFEHLRENETFDYVLWTGDLPAHNIWNQSRQDQLDAYAMLVELFVKYFPDKPIYSVIGNHESCPVDSFAPHYANLPKNFSINWLYSALAKYWNQWVDKSQFESVKRIASYVVKPFTNLRIISLNTMYCSGLNFWVYLNQSDPDNVLAWLAAQLQEAESLGDKVHIIGHIPPSECLSQWSLNYYRIINRYEDTVRGQFFGHTHNDHFAVFYDDLNRSTRPTNVYYVAPSLTTYPYRFPAYRVYTVDGDRPNSTWRVLNHESFYLNLTLANANNITTWFKLYDVKSAFNMTTLFPDDWDRLITRMNNDNEIFERYNMYYKSRSNACDSTCKSARLCELRDIVRNYPHLCDELTTNLSVPSSKYSKFLKLLQIFKSTQDAMQYLINFASKPDWSSSARGFPFIPIPKECRSTSIVSHNISSVQTHNDRANIIFSYAKFDRIFVIVVSRLSSVLFTALFLFILFATLLLYLYR